MEDLLCTSAAVHCPQKGIGTLIYAGPSERRRKQVTVEQVEVSGGQDGEGATTWIRCVNGAQQPELRRRAAQVAPGRVEPVGGRRLTTALIAHVISE
eukprot:scaffold179587_cov29-Tisochrysis_lutea.AAC.5